MRRRLAQDMPELSTYFQSGGLVDAVLNFGLPAPVDVQVSGSNLDEGLSDGFGSGDEDSRN